MTGFNRKSFGAVKDGEERRAGGQSYAAAREEWNFRNQLYISRGKFWQIGGALGIFFGLVGVVWGFHLSGQAKIIPYVVEIDNAGRVRGGGVVHEDLSVPEHVTESAVAQFVRDLRGVTPDAKVQRDRIESLYALMSTDSAAFRKINLIMQGVDNPFEFAKTKTRVVQISSILKSSDVSYQVEWKEVEYSRSGERLEVKAMRALVTTTVSDSQDRDFLLNPLGLFVTNLEYSEVKQ